VYGDRGLLLDIFHTARGIWSDRSVLGSPLSQVAPQCVWVLSENFLQSQYPPVGLPKKAKTLVNKSQHMPRYPD
jgi:hypothetical protein